VLGHGLPDFFAQRIDKQQVALLVLVYATWQCTGGVLPMALPDYS
jgi:hypothetical protein